MANECLDSWKDYPELYIKEGAEREAIDPDSLCTYGIECLDNALFRILKNDLIVIGADTGSGKSELSLHIAQHNAKNGKTVGVYYLEGGEDEAMRRLKWKQISAEYYKNPDAEPISYQEWVCNSCSNPELKAVEAKVYEDNKDIYKDKLYFFPSDSDFNLDKFIMSLLDFTEWIEGKLHLDLIIIDHLQYFSLGSENKEIKEVTKILKEVKRITEYYNVPIILVSHLRKRGKNPGLPTQEDFYGSGNIAKISSTSILLSKKREDDFQQGIFPTYINIAKSRVGIPSTYAFLTNFNLNIRAYEKDYDIYRINEEGFASSEPLAQEKLPRWAEGAKNENKTQRQDRRYS